MLFDQTEPGDTLFDQTEPGDTLFDQAKPGDTLFAPGCWRLESASSRLLCAEAVVY